jgi:signal peptidase I
MQVLDKQRSVVDGLTGAMRTVFQALIIALVFRSFVIQSFNIPSSSMEPTLLVGDYLFVSKFSYGFSRYSLPFSLPLFSGRILAAEPNRGDVVVFRLPHDDSVDYIKRIIGLPGDRIEVIDRVIHVNGTPVERRPIADFVGENPCSADPGNVSRIRVAQWSEALPDGVSYDTLQCIMIDGFPDTTGVYVVPPGHYFMMGDNRENSEDSRFSDVGFVPFENIVGRAQVIFFSISGSEPIWAVWRWPWSVRWLRLFSVPQ